MSSSCSNKLQCLYANNPLICNKHQKNNIVYQYSGPIDNCDNTVLNEIVVMNRRSINMFYDWCQINYFFSKYNLYFNEIHIVKYYICRVFKYHFVITFNNSNYLWEKRFNKSDKGGINELKIVKSYNAFDMYELLSKYYDKPNINNLQLNQILNINDNTDNNTDNSDNTDNTDNNTDNNNISDTLDNYNYCCGNGCVNCVNNNL
jgi:hypothetical protein